ncbi:hypothetical protein L4C36_23755, partial [Photobacterium japonica]|uniref:hypothetical protein n=1 Tax=Photobacterium japonica TaxID=2910235 RepID=UPI003D09B489
MMLNEIVKNLSKVLSGNVFAAILAFGVNIYLINNTTSLVSSEVLYFYSSILIIATVFELGLANYFISKNLNQKDEVLVASFTISMIFILTVLLV